jgi:LPS export ABC transporter protein LptC
VKRLLFLALASSLAACGGNRSAAGQAPAETPAAGPTATAAATALPLRAHSEREGSQYYYFTVKKENRTLYQIRADANDSVRSTAGDARSEFVRPHVTFFEKAGSKLIADAPHAVAEERTQTVSLTGGVRARASDGATLTSDVLVYDKRTERVRADGNVVIARPSGEEIRGPHVDADLTLSQLHMGPPQ